MLSLLHISPVLLVLSAILIFKQPPVRAALVGATLAVALMLLGAGQPLSRELSQWIAQDTLILFASVAFVLAPGMMLVVLIERTGATQALSTWVGNLKLQGVQQLGFIVLGLAPLLESMTGFGVSLIAVIPVLLALFDRDKALRIALTGMVIMPWGTLGLATVVGATLLNVAPAELASQTAITSAPVFFGLALTATWIAGYRKLTAYISMLAIALLFVSVLYVASAWLGPEIAGVSAGFAVVLVGLLKSCPKMPSAIHWPAAAWPYMLLFFCVIALKILVVVTQADIWLVVQGASIAWKPLASPGVPILLVCLVLLARRDERLRFQTFWQSVYQRARRPLLTILCFLFMSQVMVKAGFLSGVRDRLSAMDSELLPFLGAILGGIGGYLTGSNVGGNVLMMPAIADLPASLLPSMAATLNSAAGHAALGSLPMIATIAGLAKINNPEEQRLVRFALVVVVVNMALVGCAGAFLAYFN